MLTEGRNPLSQRVSECRRARGRGGVQSGLRSSSLPSWCLSCCGNVYVGAGDKGPLSPTSPLFTGVRGIGILGSSRLQVTPLRSVNPFTIEPGAPSHPSAWGPTEVRIIGFLRSSSALLRRAAVLPILPAALLVFEPLFKRRPVGHLIAFESLSVGHGGAFEGPSCDQLLRSPSFGIGKVGIGKLGIGKVGAAQIRTL